MFEHFRQRNVHSVALVYLPGAWLPLRIIDALTPEISPAAVYRITALFAAIGITPALMPAPVLEWTKVPASTTPAGALDVPFQTS